MRILGGGPPSYKHARLSVRCVCFFTTHGVGQNHYKYKGPGRRAKWSDSGFSVVCHRDEQGVWATIGAIHRNFLFPSHRLASSSKDFRNPAQRNSLHFARMLSRRFCGRRWRAGCCKDVNEDWDSSRLILRFARSSANLVMKSASLAFCRSLEFF